MIINQLNPLNLTAMPFRGLGVKKGGMRNTGYDRRCVQRVASKGGETYLYSFLFISSLG
jgi:hypothetical protein